MKSDVNETDRVVLVGAGFGVWQGGRHQASARWSDVVRVRAFRARTPAGGGTYLGLALRDGSEVRVHDNVPGYQSFVTAAAAALPGMRPHAAWLAALEPSMDEDEGTVLFERGARRGR